MKHSLKDRNIIDNEGIETKEKKNQKILKKIRRKISKILN